MLFRSSLTLDSQKFLLFGDYSIGGKPFRTRLSAHPDLQTIAFDFATIPGPDGPVNGAALTKEGQILIAGAFASVGSLRTEHVARLMPSGQIDPTFSVSLGGRTISAFGAQASGIQPTPEGGAMVWGAFDSWNNIPRPGIVKLDRAGNIDISFAPQNEPIVVNFKIGRAHV